MGIVKQTISHNDYSLTTISVSVVSRCSVRTGLRRCNRNISYGVPDFNDALASIMHRRRRLRCPEVDPRDRVRVSAEISVWKIHVAPHRSSSDLPPPSLAPFPAFPPRIANAISAEWRLKLPPSTCMLECYV